MTIEVLVTRTLAERAQDVGADDGLASAVLRRAHRRPRWALLTIVGVLVVALVSATLVTYGTRRSARTGPDPRAKGVPVSTVTPVATESTTGLQTLYKVEQGPDGTTAALESLSTGAAVGSLPRVEKRGTRTWFLASSGGHTQPDVSVALGTDVNGARSILPAVGGWIVQTVSAGFTGGDTDPGSRVLFVSYTGVVTSLVTGAVRSVAVHPSGTEVAWVETTERPTWSVTLVVEEIATRKILRHVPLPAGQPGSWPYPQLVWTSDGIVASNPAAQEHGTVLVNDATVTDLPGVTGVWVPSDGSLIFVETRGLGRSTCVFAELSSSTAPTVCGPLSSVAVLGSGVVLAAIDDPQSARPRAVVIDTRSKTITVVSIPLVVVPIGFGFAYPDGDGHALVHDAERNVWLRWDVVANTVEIAPMPSGASAEISW